jgi:hypothetical protein
VPLYLVEFPLPRAIETTADPTADPTSAPELARLGDAIAGAAATAQGELVELQVGLDAGRLYAVVEAEAGDPVAVALRSAGLSPYGVVEVRLVGPTLEEVKAARGQAGYLVEWDLPNGLTMDAYLERKRANAPRYAEVPETTFLRTYVCVDMSKCLCFYRAPDEAAVRRARAAVQAPVDRLTRLAELERHARV